MCLNVCLRKMRRLILLLFLAFPPFAFADTPIPKDSKRFWDFRGNPNFTDAEYEKLYRCKTYEELRDQLLKAIQSLAPKEGEEGEEWEDGSQANIVASCQLALVRTHYLLGELDRADALLMRLHPVNRQGDAVQPATAEDSKSEGSEKPNPDSEGRSQ